MRVRSILPAGLLAQVAQAEQHVPVLPPRAAVLQRGRGESEEGSAGGGRAGGGTLAGLLRLSQTKPNNLPSLYGGRLFEELFFVLTRGAGLLTPSRRDLGGCAS